MKNEDDFNAEILAMFTPPVVKGGISEPEDFKYEYDRFAGFGKMLVHYCGTADTIIIPDGVQAIWENCFAYSSWIKKVILPDSVRYIGGCAFQVCPNLKSVQLGKNVSEICESAFASCKNLKSIVFPDSLTRIEAGAFYGCPLLKEVAVPANCWICDTAFPDTCTIIRRERF